MDMFSFLEDAGRKLDAASRVLPQDESEHSHIWTWLDDHSTAMICDNCEATSEFQHKDYTIDDGTGSPMTRDKWYAGYVLGEAGFPCPPTASPAYRKGWKAGGEAPNND